MKNEKQQKANQNEPPKICCIYIFTNAQIKIEKKRAIVRAPVCK